MKEMKEKMQKHIDLTEKAVMTASTEWDYPNGTHCKKKWRKKEKKRRNKTKREETKSRKEETNGKEKRTKKSRKKNKLELEMKMLTEKIVKTVSFEWD